MLATGPRAAPRLVVTAGSAGDGGHSLNELGGRRDVNSRGGETSAEFLPRQPLCWIGPIVLEAYALLLKAPAALLGTSPLRVAPPVRDDTTSLQDSLGVREVWQGRGGAPNRAGGVVVAAHGDGYIPVRGPLPAPD